jgi:hypothetical protein
MDSIDRLLANLTPEKPPQDGPQKVQQSVVKPAVNLSIEQLLERLGEPQKQQVRDSLLERSRSPYPANSSTLPATPTSLPIRPVPEVEAYGKQQAAIAQANEQAALVESQQQERLKQQRQSALRLQRQQELRSQAQDWLGNLDLKSTEGRWFEEFGCHYESQLDAAIAYLEALQEVDRCLG